MNIFQERSNWGFSHSNQSLLQDIFHSHLSFSNFPHSIIVRSFLFVFAYNLEYNSLDYLSPIHMSSQNKILFLDPTFQLTFSSNHILSLPEPQVFLISFHHLDSFWVIFLQSMLLQDPYLDSNISFHNLFSSIHNLHFHLENNASLNTFIF